MKVKVAVAQINFLKRDIRRHIERIKDIIFLNRSSDVIIFPELILHGHPSLEVPEGLLYRRIKKFYASINERSADIYSYVKSVDARVIFGELRGVPGAFYNVATYVDGDSVQHYAKTHIHWTENFVAGRELKAFQTPFGPVGIMICFDSAFLESWRVLALQGAKVIVNISAVPRTFPLEYMWKRCMGAALYNQVFVVYANRPGDYFSGHSAIFGPKGGMIVNAGDDETTIHSEIDLDEVEKWRMEEKIYENRHPFLYRDIVRKHAHRIEGVPADAGDAANNYRNGPLPGRMQSLR
jgi:omega-amidase